MKKINKVAIIGVGLIGGSIGMALKKRRLAKEVVGVCRRESSRKKALKFKACDKATLDFKKGIEGADIVIVAAQVGKIVNLAEKALKNMKKGAILTDVGSTKRYITEKIERFSSSGVDFIGSHPMAGSDRSGVENASDDLFENATLILTKTKKTSKKSISLLVSLWKALGSNVLVLNPKTHDRDASLASYLPHVLSYVLSMSQTKDSVKFAAGSLKDMTRVASSDPDLWKDIFLQSRKITLSSIKKFKKNLKVLETALLKKDGKKIKSFLEKARKIRHTIQSD